MMGKFDWGNQENFVVEGDVRSNPRRVEVIDAVGNVYEMDEVLDALPTLMEAGWFEHKGRVRISIERLDG